VAYRKRGTRLLSAAGLAVAAALAIQGCTSSAASNASGQGGRAASAVTTAEASKAFQSYLDAVLTGAPVYHPEALAGTTGVAYSSYSAAIQVMRYHHVQAGSPPVRFGKPVYYLPASTGYPRWFVADVVLTDSGATEPPLTPAEGAVVPWMGISTGAGRHLVLFEKATAAAPWQLGGLLEEHQMAAGAAPWQLASDSRLAPGVSPPALAKDDTGHVPVVPLSDTALLARPDVAGALQAAVVDDGPASPAATMVASGPLTTGIYQAEHDTLLGLSVPPGDVSQWELEGSNVTKFALRTADGGALVFYAMYLNTTVEVPALLNKSEPVDLGPPIAVPPYVAPLLAVGNTAPHRHLEAQQLLSFAAVDPAGSPAKIQVIAIGGGPNYAYAS
jgi:hypothetical protein